MLKITKTFTITANPEMMLKIERFLAWMHFNTSWGHSATIALDCDGDGSDTVKVIGLDGAGEHFVDLHRDYVYHMRTKTKQVEYIMTDDAPNGDTFYKAI